MKAAKATVDELPFTSAVSWALKRAPKERR